MNSDPSLRYSTSEKQDQLEIKVEQGEEQSYQICQRIHQICESNKNPNYKCNVKLQVLFDNRKLF